MVGCNISLIQKKNNKKGRNKMYYRANFNKI